MKHFNPILFSALLSINFLCLFLGPEAKAARGDSGVYFDETFFPVYVNKVESSTFPDATSAPTTGIGTDLRSTLGYVFSNKVFVGATYNLYNLTVSRDTVAGASAALAAGGEEETTSRSEFGPTVG
jgi:hypothetical protein